MAMYLKVIKVNLLVFLCLVGVGSADAQNIIIKGRVVDAETNKPVEFANLGVVGTYMGTASDFNGYYELEVGESFANYKVQISAVGYKVKEFTVDELYVLNDESIKLFSQTYGIQQVDVKADSKRLYGILKTASNIITDSYEKGYATNVYFNQVMNGNKTEAVIAYSDEAGYGNRSLASAYESRNFEATEVRCDFDVTPIKKGIIYADELLGFDIVRQRGNILDIAFVDQYDLTLAEEIVIDGDSVWVINYKLNKPDIAKTGDAYCKDYQGQILIRQNDYSVVRNELSFVSKSFFHAGRNAYRETGNVDYKCKVTAEYRKTATGKYALGKVLYDGDSAETQLKMEWLVYDYRAFEKSTGKSFYVDGESNKDFWQRFSLPAN